MFIQVTFFNYVIIEKKVHDYIFSTYLSKQHYITNKIFL